MIESEYRARHVDVHALREEVLTLSNICEIVKTKPAFTFFPTAAYEDIHGPLATNNKASTHGHYEWVDVDGVEGIAIPDDHPQATRYEYVERNQATRTQTIASTGDDGVFSSELQATQRALGLSMRPAAQLPASNMRDSLEYTQKSEMPAVRNSAKPASSARPPLRY